MGVVAAAIVVVVAVIAIPVVLVSKRNSEGQYPNYVKLNYSLSETCK